MPTKITVQQGERHEIWVYCPWFLYLYYQGNPLPHTEEDLDAMFPIPIAPLESIIIDCSAMSYLDSVGVTTLTQVCKQDVL